MVRTEISRKFRSGNVAANAARFGFACEETYQDPEGLFALLLLRRRADTPVAENRRHQLEALLRRVRARTLEIVAALDDDDLLRQHNPLMSPIVWDLGHIANYESQWLLRAVGAPAAPDDVARDATYDAFVNPRRERGALPLLDRAGALDYLEDVRARVDRHLEVVALDPSRPLTAEGYVYRMVAQHEAQHQETILQAIQLRGAELAYDPPFAGTPPPRPDRRPAGTSVLVPAGAFAMGTDDRSWAYDNERPRHVRTLDAYRIDAKPVTNGQYLAFLEDGGYRRRELWTPEGWAWCGEIAADAPAHWRRTPDGWRRLIFGGLRALDPDRPVMHVSWYEADAYARWAGKRLPTEAEWEKAAAWDPERAAPRRYPWGDTPPTPDRANLEQRLLEPSPVGSYPRGRSFYGCHQLLGDVWEWTSSWFEPYPGFEAFPYREYSEVFFGREYRVLRGGSWATLPVAARNTFRNWDYPQRRQIFAGFRCAADA
jgi:iron(II)-dependent oxidoreductase